MNYIYLIEYDGKVNAEGYFTLERAIKHLESQGYECLYDLVYKVTHDSHEYYATIKPISIV